LDNNIQPDKLIINDKAKTEALTQKNDQIANTKESLPIGKILQNTVKLLSSAGLESINVVKAMVSAKGLFPTEFNQIQIQERQAKIDNPDTKTVSYKAVSDTTKNNWFNGQVVHAKVLETHPGGRATILIDKQVIEIKLESNSQLKLQPGQSLALVVEKSTNTKLPNNTTTSHTTPDSKNIVYKEPVNTDKAVSKESIKTEQGANKAPLKTEQTINKETVKTDQSVNKEPVKTAQTINKEPVKTEQTVSKEPVKTDQSAIIQNIIN